MQPLCCFPHLKPSTHLFFPSLAFPQGGLLYTSGALYEKAGKLSVGSLKAPFVAGASLQEHLLPAAGLELWRVDLENYFGSAVAQINASGLTYLTQRRKAGLLGGMVGDACDRIQIC